MCGIAGIYNLKAVQALENDLSKIVKKLEHRGPDDEGLYTHRGLGLGHRRLTIIDLDRRSKQPMLKENLVLVFNGEIYNYVELREVLKNKGHFFTTQSDTEVILVAYQEWGENCVEHFRGMWAFSLYDKDKKILFCSRDRFGIKPFYYYKDENIFSFASEIKGLLELDIEIRANLDVVTDYLVTSNHDFQEETFFEDIFQLKASHNLIFDLNSGDFEIKKYYDLKAALPSNTSAKEYEETFLESINIHLRSDVPIGTCLSGGIDSSAVAAISHSELKKINKEKNFIAITAKSERRESDESSYAKIVADSYNMKWVTPSPVFDDFIKHIDRCLYHQEEPVIGLSVFMQYWVMKCAHENDLKVLLDGQGGDETLLGYERYYTAYLLTLLKEFKIIKFIQEYISISKKSKLTIKMIFLYMFYFPFFSIRKIVLKKRCSFVKKDYIKKALERLKHRSTTKNSLEDLQINELTMNQLSHLLKYEDKNSMAFSIEGRVPFVDHKVVEKAVSLPIEDKIFKGYTKYVLRKILEKFVPKEIAWRTHKFGFEAPESYWQNKYVIEMKTVVDNSKLLKEICKTLPNYQTLSTPLQWRLFNIAKWEQLFLS